MSQLTKQVVECLIDQGVLPPEHRSMARRRLELELTRRSRWIVRGLARESLGVATLGQQSA